MTRALTNWFYLFAGMVFLGLAKCKSILQGYANPKPFSTDESIRCIEYDIDVVDAWLEKYAAYAGEGADVRGKRVLELGPGSDLGVGLYLLAKGAAEYSAVDVNNLVESVPDAFYTELFAYLRNKDPELEVDGLQAELDVLKKGQKGRLNYLLRDDFDIAAALADRQVDVVFSQAAFEHFDDIDATVASFSKVAAPGARAIILVDLKTHSRWIRDKDPVNIYRFPDWLYRLYYFRGIPNRVRPNEYKAAFERHGWHDVRLEPGNDQLTPEQHAFFKGHLNKRFEGDESQMDYLSVWVTATFPDSE